MIESRYWKEDLIGIYRRIKPKENPSRWSEKQMVIFEKDIILGFFIIRKLMETHKVSSKTKNYNIKVFRAKSLKKIDDKNFWDIEEIYDLKNETIVTKDIHFVCNQFIHCNAIYAYRDKNRNWSGLYICSDFERNNYIYRISVEEILNVFDRASKDYPCSVSLIYSSKNDSYFMETN